MNVVVKEEGIFMVFQDFFGVNGLYDFPVGTFFLVVFIYSNLAF